MTAWIAIDWGTTHLRAWVLGERGQIIATPNSADGMGALQPDQFEAALLSLIEPYLADQGRTLVLCCGMVGARQGWQEADYIATPCNPAGKNQCEVVNTHDARLDVRILPGVKQAQPANVMRGEETQIMGFLRLNPEFDGVLCLPGTHTKWVRVSQRQIVSFSTCLTGELFSLLSEQSVLRHSVDCDGWDQDAFATTLKETVAHPASVAEQLFSLRAETLLNDLAAEQARSRLSALLIGMELAAEQGYWQAHEVAVVGATDLVEIYALALQTMGATTHPIDGNPMTLEGLRATYDVVKASTL